MLYCLFGILTIQIQKSSGGLQMAYFWPLRFLEAPGGRLNQVRQIYGRTGVLYCTRFIHSNIICWTIFVKKPTITVLTLFSIIDHYLQSTSHSCCVLWEVGNGGGGINPFCSLAPPFKPGAGAALSHYPH